MFEDADETDSSECVGVGNGCKYRRGKVEERGREKIEEEEKSNREMEEDEWGMRKMCGRMYMVRCK